MAIRYYINPELNLILYIGDKIVTGSEYFKAAETAAHDKLRKWGMVTIIDILSAETDFDLQDIKRAIAFNDKLPEYGMEPEEVIALTQSKGVRLIGETLKLLPSITPVKFEVVGTLDELITLLNMQEYRHEFISFYNACKTGT